MRGRILVDTNVVLDVLLNRKPFADASASIWAEIETGSWSGMLAAQAVTTIHYIVRREMDPAKSRRTISALLKVFKVAAVDDAVIEDALRLAFTDFEDAVTAAAAQAAGCEYIVTRDPKGFRGSPVRAVTPEVLLPLLTRLN